MNFWSYKFKRKNCQLLQPQDSLRLEKYFLRYHWFGRRKGGRGMKLAAVVYYHCLFTLEHSLKAHAIMACMSSEEGCSLCASRSLVSLSRHHAGTWLLLTDYMIRLCAAGLVRALSRNACKGAFFHPIHCSFCHRIVSSTNYSSIYFKTLISPH